MVLEVLCLMSVTRTRRFFVVGFNVGVVCGVVFSVSVFRYRFVVSFFVVSFCGDVSWSHVLWSRFVVSIRRCSGEISDPKVLRNRASPVPGRTREAGYVCGCGERNLEMGNVKKPKRTVPTRDAKAHKT